MNLLNEILPWWARWLALTLALLLVFTFGQLRGERIAGEKHIDYVTAQAERSVAIAKAQQVVVTKTQIEYVDRIKTIYVKGDEIEKQIPIYITQADTARFAVNAGFVRVYDAAWTGDDPGPAADSDREPAGISLAQVAETDVFNATACRAWRDIATGLRENYLRLQSVTNQTKQ
ncbi:hypothetical protein ACIPF8_18895 [Collimonas sp. NPDC087041]|uniref:hypothetical protein n=1 Tax=Collimonas sp. NPDC087041 TaxID=3363960 RepID=UPI0037F85B77